MRRHLIRLSRYSHFISSRLATFGWLRFAVCNTWQRSRMQNLRRMGETSDPTLSRLWTKVHEIFKQCRKPSYFPISFSDCLCHVSFRRYSPLSLDSKNRANVKVFGPNFWEKRPRLLYGSLLGRFTVHYLAKFGRVPFADLRLRSLAMKSNVRWVKMAVQFEAVCGPKFMAFRHDIWDPV